VKRGGPSGLQKEEEQELEGKPPFVLFLAMCHPGDNEQQACC
jgi:hypothetical protein